MCSSDSGHNHYLKMVHGAIESGWREANRIFRDVRTIPFGRPVKKPQKCSVVIVGAGMAGLGAARELVAAGIMDIVILEAQGRPGGRVCTIPLENSHVELGAQWIHGEDNPIYRVAHKQNLLSSTTSAEGLGPYMKTDGTELCSSLVAHVSHTISGILEDCEKFVDSDDNYPSSVGHYLEESFEEYLETCTEDTPEERMRKRDIFQWHLRFQEIDNSCSDLNTLSAKDWGKYKFTGGEDCINLLSGYSSVVDALIQDLPDKIIHYNTPVKNISWKKTMSDNNCGEDPSEYLVSVMCEDGSIIQSSHVIVTCSLGYLKSHHRHLFKPSLPNQLISVIDAMGFGVVDKIFLVYDEPWWEIECQAFQIVQSHLSKSEKTSERPDWWLHDFTGFDVLSNNPAVLLAWVGGEGAAYMEKLDENVVAENCTSLLKKCLQRKDIPLPKQIKRSSWFKNPFIIGGYSHTTTDCDKLGCGPRDLAVPVYCEIDNVRKHPVILLAGEAAHESHFSTTHGAFESGQSQARVLVDYRKNINI